MYTVDFDKNNKNTVLQGSWNYIHITGILITVKNKCHMISEDIKGYKMVCAAIW